MNQTWTDADIGVLQATYELMCTSRMNSLYCERRLKAIQNVSFGMEVSIAATASGLASLAPFSTAIGHSIWQALAILAAAVAIIRPIYAPGKKIELLTRQQHGCHSNFFALKKLAFSIRQKGSVDEEARRRYDTIFDRHVQLSIDDESAPVRRHVKKARDLTEVELPPSGFWWPKSAEELLSPADSSGAAGGEVRVAPSAEP